MNPYLKLAVSLTLSFGVMYGVMFLNADRFDHVMLSATRTYMSLLMVAPMAIIMIVVMGSMYPKKALNVGIVVGAAVVFTAVLVMLRQQTLIADVQYMKAMIPHHSSAIMVSQKADLKDPEVIRLSKEIIAAQEREIAEMKAHIDRLGG